MTEEDEWQERIVVKSLWNKLRKILILTAKVRCFVNLFPHVSARLDCLETFDNGTTVKLFRQCLSLLKMQMLVINPTFAHLFWCGEAGWLHLALLNPSITQGSRINGMQRKAVSARRHAGRIPAACTRRVGEREEHWSRNRSKYPSHILNAWWQVSFGWVLIFKIKKRHTEMHK